jgi:PEP-CTERM/exosortase A-associated glycosyltransferase
MAALASRVEELARDQRPDVIHAHSPVLNALPAIRVGRRLGIPVVYEVRAFWEDAAVDHGTTREGSLRYRATRGLETRALRRAGHVTTICEGLRQDIVARGIPAGRVTVVPNAVDPSEFRAAGAGDPALRRELGIDGARVLGFIGSFYGYEGLGLLLAAAPGIRARLSDVKILLVGGGPEDAALRAAAAAGGLSETVIFTGRVPHDSVARYYDLVDVLVYPRLPMRLTELVTPLKPLEAMAQGRLVVASDVGGHREIIRDGSTGILFRAGDPDALAAAVASAFADGARADAIRRRARAFVEEERTWAKSVARYLPVYERLTAR